MLYSVLHILKPKSKTAIRFKSDPTYTEMGYRDWKCHLEEDCGLLEHDAPASQGKDTAL